MEPAQAVSQTLSASENWESCMSLKPVTVSLNQDVAVIAVDSPPVNTITAALREGLFAVIADIRTPPGIADHLLICEGSTLFSGVDIGEFAGPPKEAEFRDLFR